jgi:hypothetical protein
LLLSRDTIVGTLQVETEVDMMDSTLDAYPKREATRLGSPAMFQKSMLSAEEDIDCAGVVREDMEFWLRQVEYETAA